MTDGLHIERRGAITVLTLDRPERLNALSHGMLRSLHTVLDVLAGDYSQRFVLLRGSGRGFCAGIDLKDQASGATWVEGVGKIQASYALQEAVGELILKMRRVPQPVVPVVQGVAAGGGLSLACAADIRIAEPGARFNAAFSKLGVSGGDLGSSWLLPRIVGFDHAAELLYTGRMIDADEAARIGLFSRVVAEGSGFDSAMALIDEMSQVAPWTSRMTKSLLNLSRDGVSLQQMIEYENRTKIMMAQTQDFAEAVDAFVQRRSPSFTDH